MSNVFKIVFKSVKGFATSLEKNENVDQSFKILSKLGMPLEVYQRFKIDVLAARYSRHPRHSSTAGIMLSKIEELKQKKHDLENQQNEMISMGAISSEHKNRKRQNQSPEKQKSKTMRMSVPETGSTVQKIPSKKSVSSSPENGFVGEQKLVKTLGGTATKMEKDAELDAVKEKVFKKMEQHKEGQRKTKFISTLPFQQS